MLGTINVAPASLPPPSSRYIVHQYVPRHVVVCSCWKAVITGKWLSLFLYKLFVASPHRRADLHCHSVNTVASCIRCLNGLVKHQGVSARVVQQSSFGNCIIFSQIWFLFTRPCRSLITAWVRSVGRNVGGAGAGRRTCISRTTWKQCAVGVSTGSSTGARRRGIPTTPSVAASSCCGYSIARRRALRTIYLSISASVLQISMPCLGGLSRGSMRMPIFVCRELVLITCLVVYRAKKMSALVATASCMSGRLTRVAS